MTCACACNTAAIVCSNLLLFSHSASDVMLKLIPRLSAPITPSSCHAMYTVPQMPAMQASPAVLGPYHFTHQANRSQAARLSHVHLLWYMKGNARCSFQA